jgi:hypothetical protein
MTKNYQFKLSVMPRLRNPDLGDVYDIEKSSED